MQETQKDEIAVSKKNMTLKVIKQNIIEFVKFALIAVIIVIPIRMYIAQPFIVSGSSMFPTFHDGEYLIVDELSYNLGEPKRYDPIIFHYPKDHKKYFIKRIIGLPNETVIINNGIVTIKNNEFPEGFNLEEKYINEKFGTDGIYINNEDEYFVMGDNRNFSSDSRVWGKLTSDLIVGRAYLRLLPLNRISYLPGNIK
jgi:signal peptidase I